MRHTLTWKEFKRGLVGRYDHAATRNCIGELTKLKQEGISFDEYQSEFIRLSHHVYGLLEFLLGVLLAG